MLGALIVVSAFGFWIFPARTTGDTEVMLTKPWLAPEKLMLMGLSASTELVRVSVAPVTKKYSQGASLLPSGKSSGGSLGWKPSCPALYVACKLNKLSMF